MFRAQGGGEGPAHRHPFAERGGFERNETEAEYARALAAYLAERKRALEAAQREAQKKEMERRKQQQREEEARLVAERKEQRRRKKDRRAKAQQEQKETAKEMRRASQRKRSEIFRMARSGDAEGVQRGIWEQNVDAAGQECLVGMEDDPAFLDSRGDADYGLKETFLHIFARRGDLDMVKWLVDHSAHTSHEQQCILAYKFLVFSRCRGRRTRLTEPHSFPCCSPTWPYLHPLLLYRDVPATDGGINAFLRASKECVKPFPGVLTLEIGYRFPVLAGREIHHLQPPL